ncbi:MAG: chromosome segregation SMC family protein [Leptonema sp. (in: bacteria)]
MFVKKIRLVGFKSFADETILEFKSGITAIVGPNGSGKSNIVDAIRWVLGEKSTKALRGRNIEDVIFLGSETRKPAGMAEVEIYFDNKDRTLPLDLDEVVLSRRVYLNSSSEFFLNGKKTTKKEIDKILMDTGIGKTAYSVMEQGKMSEILKSSPEERRYIFDEAAGISRYKLEKEDTLKRLQDTKQNLLRLNDILKEKEKEINQLEKQARKTKQYLILKEHLSRHDKHIRYLKYIELKEKEKETSLQLKEKLSKKNQIFQNINSCELQMEEIEKQNQKEIELMQNIEIEYHQLQSQMNIKKEEIERIQLEQNTVKVKLEQISKRMKNEAKYLKEIEKKYQESLQIELDLGNELEILKQKIQDITNKISSVEESILQINSEIENNFNKIEILEQESNQELEKLKKITEDFLSKLEQKQLELKYGEEKKKKLKILIEENLQFINEKIQNYKNLYYDGSFTNETYLDFINSLSFEELQKSIREYFDIDIEFREIFFGEMGIFSRKEEIDKKMIEIVEKKKEYQNTIKELQNQKISKEKELEKFKQDKVQFEILQRDYEVRKTTSVEVRDGIQTQIGESKERLKFLKEEEETYRHQLTYFSDYKKRLEDEIYQLIQKIKESENRIKNLKKNTSELKNKILELKRNAQKEREKIEKLLPEITNYERMEENTKVALLNLEEELYNDYQISPSELIHQCEHLKLNYQKEVDEYQRIKNEILALGQFNALAIEQYEFSKKSYEEILKQKEDIENSEKNIKEIINKINEESIITFINTFKQIQINFENVFKTLFGGGNAQISLTDPSNPLESGIQIFAQPPGKKNTTLSLLSGGEQNLTAIALMFAIYLVKPSPFCLLDEIDAPLDDSNVKKFLKMLSGFSHRSQFLVITHNKLTISEANVIFGITQEESGVSKVVSLKLENYKIKNV